MNSNFLRNVLIKGLFLFLVFDLLFVFVNPSAIGKISLYNRLLDGRQRFPFGENPSESYNLSLFNLEAMFASHIISNGRKPADEFRVITIGDSSIWGTLLHPAETLAGQLDSAGLAICGRTVRVYNLGYPTISLLKDLLVLDYALRYKPDLVIWFVSLEAFPVENQLSSPFVANNAFRVDDLISRYNISLVTEEAALVKPGPWEMTLVGRRRELADLFRLQMYGILWTATGIDQSYPMDYQKAQTDFDTDVSYHSMLPPVLDETQLDFGLVDAGYQIAGSIPMVIINEPILISVGENSDMRYNFLYPRWAFDQWRLMMSSHASEYGWDYLDLWNIVPGEEFTNSAIHLTPSGEMILAEQVKKTIFDQSCK